MKKWFTISLLLLVLSGCSEEAWQESDVFTTSDSISMLGVEQKMAIAYDPSQPIIAGETNNYEFYFWVNKEKDVLGKFDVEATHEESGKTVSVFSSQNTDAVQPLHGATHHLPALMSLPDAGLWKIEVKFDTAVFEKIYINVQ